jgi:hypothetical protein
MCCSAEKNRHLRLLAYMSPDDVGHRRISILVDRSISDGLDEAVQLFESFFRVSEHQHGGPGCYLVDLRIGQEPSLCSHSHWWEKIIQ